MLSGVRTGFVGKRRMEIQFLMKLSSPSPQVHHLLVFIKHLLYSRPTLFVAPNNRSPFEILACPELHTFGTLVGLQEVQGTLSVLKDKVHILKDFFYAFLGFYYNNGKGLGKEDETENESARSANGHNIIFSKILLTCEVLGFRDITSIMRWNFVRRKIRSGIPASLGNRDVFQSHGTCTWNQF